MPFSIYLYHILTEFFFFLSRGGSPVTPTGLHFTESDARQIIRYLTYHPPLPTKVKSCMELLAAANRCLFNIETIPKLASWSASLIIIFRISFK